MPKSQYMDPNELRKSGYVTFTDIPVNQYNKTIEEEKKVFSTEDFLRIYHDMATILSLIHILYEGKKAGKNCVISD